MTQQPQNASQPAHNTTQTSQQTPQPLQDKTPLYRTLPKYQTYLLIAAGCIATGLGAAGVVVPGLPTTPFVLLASWCFYRSSPRLQAWLIRSFLGNYIRNYTARGGITRRQRITIILLMAGMVTLSCVFFLHTLLLRVIVASAGVIGCLVVAFAVPAAKTTTKPSTTSSDVQQAPSKTTKTTSTNKFVS